jgi:aromatic ring hydroxylase
MGRSRASRPRKTTRTAAAPRKAAARPRAPSAIRTGDEYIASLRDGRALWVLGVGAVDDVTTHPATAPLVREYAAWYDRHADPAWADVLLAPSGRAWASTTPRTSADLRAMGRAIHAVALLSAGNISHTPGYGVLIALGLREATHGSERRYAAAAAAYHEAVARSGRFVTFSSGGAAPADRFRAPADTTAMRVVARDKAGIVVDGMVGVHTAVPFAHEVVVLARPPGGPADTVWFSVPVTAPGVRVIAREPAAAASASGGPLTARFDELDCMLACDRVRIPDERVFGVGAACDPRGREVITGWLVWHQLIGWLARADFSLGLGVLLADALGAAKDTPMLDRILDLVIDAETTRTCLAAAELDPETSPSGFALPRRMHVAPGALHALEARGRMDLALRNLAGAASLVAPTAADLDDDRIAGVLERAFGGGGYTARQRGALVRLAWDHLASGLAGRGASYEMFGSGGITAWRMRLRRWFDRYEELADAVRTTLDVELPALGGGGDDEGRGRGNA